jgi:nucleotidyltransferase substrate binding protein (TIGR01987 family)
MNEKSIRWKQRFQNLEKAFRQLSEAIEIVNSLSSLEKEGLVQRFEYTLELAWKTLKDYLGSQNVGVKFPREVIKAGFQYELIEDGEIWLEMLEMRNMMIHTYDEEIFNASIEKITGYFYPEIEKLFLFLKNQINT